MTETIDIATPEGRRRARNELVWGDHGFLRARFRNLHQISPEMWRANQPSPEQIARYRTELGIQTIINLRGTSDKGYYLLEKEACELHGIRLVDFKVYSRDTMTPAAIADSKTLFDTIAYPALMHCKSGADRAGIMSTLYMHFRQGLPIREAMEQLSFKYLHIEAGKTGVLDYFFKTYLKEGESAGLSFMDWVQTAYDGPALKRRFLEEWRGKLNLDQLLRRE